MRFEPDVLRERLAEDSQFAYASRFCSARVRIIITGDQTLLIHLVDGRVTNLTDEDTGFDSADIQLEAPPEVWAELMQAEPRPFYQDFWSAKFHHGFRIEGDFDLMSAYYPALQRLCAVLRTLIGVTR